MKNKKYVVKVPVADLRREPILAFICNKKDPLQESQLLLGEQLTISKESENWVYVEALNQLQFHKDSGWKGYPGWVQKEQICEVPDWPSNNLVVKSSWAEIKSLDPDNLPFSSLSMGTKLEGINRVGESWIFRLPTGKKAAVAANDVRELQTQQPLSSVRKDLIYLASQHVNSPYVWGGRSAYRLGTSNGETGFDCSGFINLLYTVYGLSIPRDAQDQFLSAKPLETKELQPGDLIFLASLTQPQRMRHVMLYTGGDNFLDTNGTDRCVVASTASKRFQIPFQDMIWGQAVGQDRIYFGSYE